jgi:hypothetical protein
LHGWPIKTLLPSLLKTLDLKAEAQAAPDPPPNNLLQWQGIYVPPPNGITNLAWADIVSNFVRVHWDGTNLTGFFRNCAIHC